MMTACLPSLLIGLVVGAALVGAWWWWIGHKAKARALAASANQVLQGVEKKIP
jgi:hypothetical protein